jgi:hypothetical protein
MCLMRSMYSVDFCDACIEGLWMSLLGPLSLIDNVTQVAQPDGATNVTLELLPLAQFRDVPNDRESYTIFWYGADEEEVLEEWTNQTTALFGPGIAEFGVEVKFSTTQIRIDTAGVTVESERYAIE